MRFTPGWGAPIMAEEATAGMQSDEEQGFEQEQEPGDTGFTIGAAEVSGNCALIEVLSDVSRAGLHRQVKFLAEPRSSPQPLWFHLDAACLGGCTISLLWANADQALGNPRRLEEIRPVMRVDGGPWFRCPEVRLEDTTDGRRELWVDFLGSANRLALALCYPYHVGDFFQLLEDVHLDLPWTVIGATAGGRSLPRLILPCGEPEAAGVYVIARQHAGETPGSWVVDGMLRHLAGAGEREPRDLGCVDWWFAPFADLDGVQEGDYGKDAWPCDFNRAWERLPLRPEVMSLQRDLARWAERHPRRLILDLHAPGHHEPGLWVFYPRAGRPPEQREATARMAGILADLFPELPPDSLAKETTYPSRFNPNATVNSWAWDHLDQTPALGIEISYQRLADRPLEIADYREIGARLVEGVYRYFGE